MVVGLRFDDVDAGSNELEVLKSFGTSNRAKQVDGVAFWLPHIKNC